MGAKARHVVHDASSLGMGLDDPIDAIRIEWLFEIAGGAVSKRPEQRPFEIPAMTRLQQIVIDALDGFGTGWQIADFAALAQNAEMGSALSVLPIPNLERAKLGAAETVEKQGGQDRSVTLAF